MTMVVESQYAGSGITTAPLPSYTTRCFSPACQRGSANSCGRTSAPSSLVNVPPTLQIFFEQVRPVTTNVPLIPSGRLPTCPTNAVTTNTIDTTHNTGKITQKSQPAKRRAPGKDI